VYSDLQEIDKPIFARVLEKKVLRRIIEPEGYEVTGHFGMSFNEELCNLHRSRSIGTSVKEIKMGQACSSHGRDKRFM
jgi:hypothetical protein